MRLLSVVFKHHGVFPYDTREGTPMGFVRFMSSTAGRWTRGIAGGALLAIGLVVGGGAGWVLIALGAVFIAVGLFDVCLVAPLLGKPFWGKAFRAKAS
jgi:hypothetical protein